MHRKTDLDLLASACEAHEPPRKRQRISEARTDHEAILATEHTVYHHHSKLTIPPKMTVNHIGIHWIANQELTEHQLNEPYYNADAPFQAAFPQTQLDQALHARQLSLARQAQIQSHIQYHQARQQFYKQQLYLEQQAYAQQRLLVPYLNPSFAPNMPVNRGASVHRFFQTAPIPAPDTTQAKVTHDTVWEFVNENPGLQLGKL